jgi:hypothetical protein
MLETITVTEVMSNGTTLRSAEAVAIVQKLINEPTPVTPQPPFGPPMPHNVYLGEDGSVACRACEVTPAVSEIAIFLQTVIPQGTERVPGGLRYAIARGLLEVDAPPFDSVEAFSQALARFEQGDRSAVVRGLVQRARTEPRSLALVPRRNLELVARVPMRDRRRSTPEEVASLRRELRLADVRLYEQRQALESRRTNASTGTSRRRVSSIAAGIAAGFALISSGEVMHKRKVAAPAPAPANAATAMTLPARPPAPPMMPPYRAAAPPAERPIVVPVAATSLPSARRTPSPRRTVQSARADSSAKEDHISARQSGVLVAALDVDQRPVFSPVFASNGSAMFSHPGRTSDGRGAILPEDGTDDGLRVMAIVDDGAKNYHVQPSPDGQRIAFDSDRDGGRAVFVAHRDGSNVRRVSGPGYAAVPTWSPDGRQLAYVRAETQNPRVWNLWLLAVDSGELRQLTHYQHGQPWRASWFPDGRRVAYTHEDRLVVLDLETDRTRQFASPVEGSLVRTAAVSPDGRRIIFQVFHQGGWLLELNDGSMRCVITDPTAEEFVWSPDGRRVAFHSRRDGEWGIWVMAPRGGN